MAFHILEKDYEKFVAYLFFIQKCIDGRTKTPSIVLNRFFELFSQPEIEFENYINEFRNEAIKIAKRLKLNYSVKIKIKHWLRFSTPPDEITGIVTHKPVSDKDEKPLFTELSFYKFIESFFRQLKGNGEEHLLKTVTNKKNFIIYSYTLLHNYLKEVPKGKHPIFYQKSVLIGAIGAALGLFPEEKDYRIETETFKHYGEFLAEKTSHYCAVQEKELSKKR